jgi:hypothetical protein
MTAENQKTMRAYYTRENFPELVAHSENWDIYSKAKRDEYGHIHCAAIPRTPDRLPHGYGTIHHVARMIAQGHLRPIEGNIHLTQ